jgi:ketosteroid isomerase-like protein
MGKRIVRMALVLVMALPIAGWSAPDAETEKRAVARVIDDSIGWFRNKDFALLYSTMSNGPDLFLYQLDTGSTIRGFEEFEKYSEIWRSPDVKYAGHRFEDLRITLSRGGDVAWFSAGLEDCAAVKDRPARCFTTRYTGVLEKRGGRWRIVQAHFSLPAERIAEDWAARTAHAPGEGGP